MTDPQAAAERILENRGEPVTFTEMQAVARAYQEVIEAARKVLDDGVEVEGGLLLCDPANVIELRRVLASAATPTKENNG